jgi:hypothetical protein
MSRNRNPEDLVDIASSEIEVDGTIPPPRKVSRVADHLFGMIKKYRNEKELIVIREAVEQQKKSIEESEISMKNMLLARLSPRVDQNEKKFFNSGDPRIKICEEFVESEMSYVTGLEMALNQFYMRLEALIKLPNQKAILSETEFGNVFINLKDIYELNSKFLQDLVECKDSGDHKLVEKIADLFIYYAKFFMIYSMYCKSHHAAVRAYEKLLEKNSEFKSFIEVSEYCAGQTLNSLMITPVQRIPRYVMLLKNMQKFSNADRPQIPNLSQAIKLSLEVAEQIDKSIAMAEAREKVIQIQQYFFKDKILLVEPSRYCIRFDHLNWLSERKLLGQRRVKPVFLALFNDLVICASSSNGSKSSQMKFHCSMHNLKIENIIGEEEAKYSFTMSNSLSSGAGSSIVIICPSDESKQQWMHMIQNAKSCFDTGFKSIQPVKNPLNISFSSENNNSGYLNEVSPESSPAVLLSPSKKEDIEFALECISSI